MVVDEEIPPHIVKRFECLEKRYINATNYYYYYSLLSVSGHLSYFNYFSLSFILSFFVNFILICFYFQIIYELNRTVNSCGGYSPVIL